MTCDSGQDSKVEESSLPLASFLWTYAWSLLDWTVEALRSHSKRVFSFQIEACNKEAEKIESLINSDSPTLASHVPLSALIISQVQVSSSLTSSAPASRPPLHSLLLFLSLGFTVHLLWTP